MSASGVAYTTVVLGGVQVTSSRPLAAPTTRWSERHAHRHQGQRAAHQQLHRVVTAGTFQADSVMWTIARLTVQLLARETANGLTSPTGVDLFTVVSV
ncbi:hypothetical protein [[Kitasatospora] papulosa]|uniref:hypothetical protein n=1 Tax=[Kitasatospora] papulosa TaxID=1464011 RepID=UPI003681A631